VWDSEQYRRFAVERNRPFLDLLSQLDLADPRAILDLGCGDGRLTRILAARWPAATVVGVDSSAEMLRAAAPLAVPGHVAFVRADLRAFRPARPLDLVFSNAALHWVDDHEDLVAQLADIVAPGGALAFQIPGNFGEPSHTILRALCAEPRWAARLGPLAEETRAREEALLAQPPIWYVERLAARGFLVDAWETTYLHLLDGDDAVLQWTRGTTLRPVLAALSGDDERAFTAEYGARLRGAYPRRPFGTAFPFRRLFVVARRH
jgi:trans-aconitate 2-methyltransferase